MEDESSGKVERSREVEGEKAVSEGQREAQVKKEMEPTRSVVVILCSWPQKGLLLGSCDFPHGSSHPPLLPGV